MGDARVVPNTLLFVLISLDIGKRVQEIHANDMERQKKGRNDTVRERKERGCVLSMKNQTGRRREHKGTQIHMHKGAGGGVFA